MLTRTRTEVRSSHLRAFTLLSAARATRVALVPERAVLLAGDQVTVSVRVGVGRSLEIVEPGGTVAYAMRGGAARWEVDIEVEAGGSLVWRGEPFVVAEGADVRRRLAVVLEDGASIRLRETLVLGRTGEAPGHLVSRTEASRCDRPVLVEELWAPLGLGPHRVFDQVMCLGAEDEPGDAPGAERLELESGDHLHRWLGSSLHLSPLERR